MKLNPLELQNKKGTKSMRYSLLLSLIVLTCSFATPTRASEFNYQDSTPFDRLTPSFRYWLNDPLLFHSESRTEDGFANYQSLAAISLHRLLEEGNTGWKIFRLHDYDWNDNYIQATFRDTQLTPDGKSADIALHGYWYLYKDDVQTGPHAIVSIKEEWTSFPGDGGWYRDQVRIYFKDDQKTEALEFWKTYQTYLTEKNSMKNGVLELTGQSEAKLRFMKNVSDFGLNWKDLILKKDLKTQVYNHTEAYLKELHELKTLGISAKKGLLLYGPPGTGKTLLAQILISAIQSGSLKNKATLFVVTARHLKLMHAVKILFQEAAKLGPSVIFMEDIDLLGISERDFDPSGQKNPTDQKSAYLLNEFLNSLDGIAEKTNLLFIGTTNEPSRLDPALIRSGRLGIHLKFGYPGYLERKELFERFATVKAAWENDLTSEWLATETEGLSGADLVEIIAITKQIAMTSQSFQNGELLLTKAHFEEAFRMFREGAKLNSHKLTSFFGQFMNLHDGL